MERVFGIGPSVMQMNGRRFRDGSDNAEQDENEISFQCHDLCILTAVSNRFAN